jgi:hypothetical protein
MGAFVIAVYLVIFSCADQYMEKHCEKYKPCGMLNCCVEWKKESKELVTPFTQNPEYGKVEK